MHSGIIIGIVLIAAPSVFGSNYGNELKIQACGSELFRKLEDVCTPAYHMFACYVDNTYTNLNYTSKVRADKMCCGQQCSVTDLRKEFCCDGREPCYQSCYSHPIHVEYVKTMTAKKKADADDSTVPQKVPLQFPQNDDTPLITVAQF